MQTFLESRALTEKLRKYVRAAQSLLVWVFLWLTEEISSFLGCK